MSIDTEARDMMKNISWSRGGCDSCNRENCSVAPYGRDEDGYPIGYLCFICMKREARDYAIHRYDWIEA